VGKVLRSHWITVIAAIIFAAGSWWYWVAHAGDIPEFLGRILPLVGLFVTLLAMRRQADRVEQAAIDAVGRIAKVERGMIEKADLGAIKEAFEHYQSDLRSRLERLEATLSGGGARDDATAHGAGPAPADRAP
jgi:hypothetical protein